VVEGELAVWVIESVSSEINAVPLLRQSVQRAQDAISAGPPDEARINAVVSTLAAELALKPPP
jgi:hypothetical protein